MMMTRSHRGRFRRSGAAFPLAVWLFVPLGLCAQPSMPDRIIVQSDMGPISYGVIACGPRVQPAECHALEQQRLATRIKRMWIAAAASQHAIVLTPADEADIAAQLKRTSAFYMKAAARFHDLATFALRIRSGEAQDAVYADAAREGIAEHELDGELELVRTRDVAEREAHKDFVADLERSTREYSIERARRLELTALVERHAREHHTSFTAAEERLWSDVITTIHMRLLDETYQLPSRTGVLEHEHSRATP